MKGIAPHFVTGGVAAALAAVLAAGTPALAASTRSHATDVAAKGKSAINSGNVEARIKTLHERLKIKPEQEAAFNNVAQVMRDNDAAMKNLRQQKAANLESANALDQVNSYAAVVDTHADGIHKFIPAFKSLYDSLSDEQKKAADATFRERAREAQRRGRP